MTTCIAISLHNEIQMFSQLNKRCHMSPGKFTEKYTTKLARKLKRQRLAQAQKSVKRRRLELKKTRISKQATQSVLEGTM